MPSVKQINVVVGILFNQQQQILLSTRPQGKSYEGYWEFAGGKIEAGETRLAALARELYEELNINVEKASYWLTKSQKYPSACIRLHFFKVGAWSGDIQAKEGQQISWQSPVALTVSPVLMANTSVVKSLCLPEQFTGSTDSALTGMAYGQCIRFIPEAAAQAEDAILIDSDKLSLYLKKKTLPYSNSRWIAAKIRHLHDWAGCYRLGIDAVVYTVLDKHDQDTLLRYLQKSMPTPLIIDNPNGLELGNILSGYRCAIITAP